MHFVLYSDLNVAQGMTALIERMNARPTSTRPDLDGWVDKSGRFSLRVSMPVLAGIHRRTTLRGRMMREGSRTVIEGQVSSGVPPQNIPLVYAALIAIIILILGNGGSMFALLLIPAGLLLYIPMRGDYDNSRLLMGELQKTLKARPPDPPRAEAKQAKREAARSIRSQGRASRPAADRAPANRPTATRTATEAKQPSLFEDSSEEDA